MKRALPQSGSNELQDCRYKKARKTSPGHSAEQIQQATSYVDGSGEGPLLSYSSYSPPNFLAPRSDNDFILPTNPYIQTQAAAYLPTSLALSKRLDSHWIPPSNSIPPNHPGTYLGGTAIWHPPYGAGPARANLNPAAVASSSNHRRAIYAPRQQGMYDRPAMLGENMGGTGLYLARAPSGSFYKAKNVVINQATMIENAILSASGNLNLEALMPYTDPRAYVDSSARHPPPRCHPDTRKHILKKLTMAFNDPDRPFNMIWLRGPAGTGKSAVAQTFVKESQVLGRHSASYFFSRPRGWNKYITVIPSLVYQLAVNCPPYRNLVTNAIASDPQILDQSPPVQFERLIIHPFRTIQTHNNSHDRILIPFLIALDGLDECESEEAQCELVDMIANAVRDHKDLPLFWLICSRMEEHLQNAFAEVVECGPVCGQETLAIDAECRDDVERLLRSEFAKIRSKYRSSVPRNWPSESEFGIVARAVSGLFIFGSTVMKDIGASAHTNPVQRLQVLISFLKNVEQTAATNPLEALDAFYAHILSDVPETVFPTTWRILAFFIYMPKDKYHIIEKPSSAQALANFLDLDQASFYTALRQLHSVISIPTPKDAFTTPLQFYHASFQDFLLDPQHSGKFFISKQKALVAVLKSILFWNESDSVRFHSTNCAFYSL
uniref:Nephrocystin 3-like N-terminal domain-containing protein n=1 Tax=Leucocoprinus birnbaumii TaxID=56174 RepID=A0AAD5VFV3_9AGAR